MEINEDFLIQVYHQESAQVELLDWTLSLKLIIQINNQGVVVL